MIKQSNESSIRGRKTLICTFCNKKGHSSNECNRSIKKNYSQYITNNPHERRRVDRTQEKTKTFNKLDKIMGILGTPIPETLEELKKVINNQTQTLKALFEALPSNFKSIQTIKAN